MISIELAERHIAAGPLPPADDTVAIRVLRTMPFGAPPPLLLGMLALLRPFLLIAPEQLFLFLIGLPGPFIGMVLGVRCRHT